MSNFSPLRYPGGKGKLLPYVETVLKLNGLEGGHYVEPFAGGAAVALSLLLTGKVNHIHINDLDWEIFSFWKAVVDHSDELIARIVDTPVTVDAWLEARAYRNSKSYDDVVASGFTTFFLNRTNRSGILNGGMIGGLAQSGEWKLDCRFNKDELVSRIQKIGEYRSRITLTNIDASDYLENHIKSIEEKSLIYIDPPYYVKGAYLYRNHFTHADHVALAHVVKKIEHHRWLVSYDNVEQIRSIYSGCSQEPFSIGYSARNYGQGSEVMIFSPSFKRPTRVFSSKKDHRQFKKEAAA